MQSWFEVWKGVKTIQNFAAIEINRKFTKLNFTNSRMSFLWIKFSFSFQCGICWFFLLLTNGGNQQPMEGTNNRWREPMTEENIWNAAMPPIPNPGVTYFRFCQFTKCARHTLVCSRRRLPHSFLATALGATTAKLETCCKKLLQNLFWLFVLVTPLFNCMS